MKKIILFFIVLISFTFWSKAQLLNQKITNDNTGEVILIGECTIDAFQKDEFERWYRSEYHTYNYNLKKRVLDSIAPNLKDVKIKIILGSWCGDSKLHFPHFMSTLDYLKFIDYEIIAVDRNKNANFINIDNLNVVKVPTFIIYKNNIELGRIIETPIESIEEDMLDIFKGRYSQSQ